MTRFEFARFAAPTVNWTIAEMVRLGSRDGELSARGAGSGNDAPILKTNIFAQFDNVLVERRSRPITVSASIVVCTRNRPDDLVQCLASLEAERADGREIVVVDNGPDRETEAAVRAAGVRYVTEPTPGLNRARNAGLRAAGGDVVVFVDDDVRPEPGWVDALLRRFDRPNVGVVCGLVLPASLDTDAQVAFQYELGFGGMRTTPVAFDSSFLRLWRWGAPIWEIGAGANMAVRRDLALSLGGFDERVGPGGTGGGGDDTEFWHNVLFAGGEARYEPLAVVRHRHRSTWPELKRQAYGYSLGHMVSLFVTFARGRDPADLLRAFVFLPMWYLMRIARAPMRWLHGDPDRLLVASLRGYLASFRHVGMARPERSSQIAAPMRPHVHAE